MVNVRTSLDILKTKVSDLSVDKLSHVPIDLKKLSDVVWKEVFNEHKIQHTRHKSK